MYQSRRPGQSRNSADRAKLTEQSRIRLPLDFTIGFREPIPPYIDLIDETGHVRGHDRIVRCCSGVSKVVVRIRELRLGVREELDPVWCDVGRSADEAELEIDSRSVRARAVRLTVASRSCLRRKGEDPVSVYISSSTIA